MAGAVKSLGHAVPQPEVRGEGVDENEGRPGPGPIALLDVKRDSVRDQLSRRPGPVRFAARNAGGHLGRR